MARPRVNNGRRRGIAISAIPPGIVFPICVSPEGQAGNQLILVAFSNAVLLERLFEPGDVVVQFNGVPVVVDDAILNGQGQLEVSLEDPLIPGDFVRTRFPSNAGFIVGANGARVYQCNVGFVVPPA